MILYKECDEDGMNLVCELYQHDLTMKKISKWDPNPLVGDLQLQAFASFMKNQITWSKALSFSKNA